MSQDHVQPAVPAAYGDAATSHEEHGMAGEGGHGDDHHDPHMDAGLGPIDWPAWGAAALGIGIAGFVALLMALVVGIP
jgi:hypothetical protein